MEYIPRVLEEQITATLKNRKVLLLLGARQVGKTTLIEHILKSHRGHLLNMDVKTDRNNIIAAADRDPADLTRIYGKSSLLIIDEAQGYPDIGRTVKGWFDKQVDLKIILLGSSTRALINIAGSELVGRNEKLWLTPLLFREILTQQSWFTDSDSSQRIHRFFSDQVTTQLKEQLIYGSYPETYRVADKRDYLQNLVSDYLLKDIFTTSVVRSPDDVRRLLIELAHEVGKQVSIRQLVTRTDLSRQTVKRYLDLLVGISVIFPLVSYTTDPYREINSSVKYYFWDTGVRNELLRQWTDSESRPDIDALWENWVIAEINKQRLTFNRHEDLYFWESRNGSTVDLIVKEDSTLHPFDIRFNVHDTKPSRAFHNRYGLLPQTIHPGNILTFLL